MSWNLEGMRVNATYLNEFAVSGVVELSRVAYGGNVNHHIRLDEPINVYGAERDRVIIEHSRIEKVKDNTE
jgi:hypothetical protein